MTDFSKTMPPPARPVNKTSVVTDYKPHPQEITVRFAKWTQVGFMAYQRGQSCGLLVNVAEPLIRRGVCEPVNDASRKILAEYIDWHNRHNQ